MATRAVAARVLTGGEAVAEAMRQIDPDVVPVYPITPQTPMIQGFAKFAAAGRVHGEIINVESEHSAMSAAIGAALAGARTITATSSQGLALMAEVGYIAAAMRAPGIVLSRARSTSTATTPTACSCATPASYSCLPKTLKRRTT
jgi:pyruvate ferredoxin oxidoreductase alpha subunit